MFLSLPHLFSCLVLFLSLYHFISYLFIYSARLYLPSSIKVLSSRPSTIPHPSFFFPSFPSLSNNLITPLPLPFAHSTFLPHFLTPFPHPLYPTPFPPYFPPIVLLLLFFHILLLLNSFRAFLIHPPSLLPFYILLTQLLPRFPHLPSFAASLFTFTLPVPLSPSPQMMTWSVPTKVQVEVDFSAHEADGVLLYVQQNLNGDRDFLALVLNGGYVWPTSSVFICSVSHSLVYSFTYLKAAWRVP